MINTLKDKLAKYLDHLIASDPGLMRLRLASRSTAAALLALGLLYMLETLAHAPFTAMLLGVIIALISSVAVNDDSPTRQQITMLILPAPAALAVLLGATVAPSPIAGDILFVVIISGAVYVRSFGPRGLAISMIVFISYFFSLFLHATFGQLPWLMIALVLGVACAFIVRFLIFQHHPKNSLRSITRAFYARVSFILDKIISTISEDTSNDRFYGSIRRHIIKLNETVLMIENELGDIADSTASPSDNNSPILALFDVELTMERLTIVSHQKLSGSQRNNTLKALQRLRNFSKRRQRNEYVHISSDYTISDSLPWHSELNNVAKALNKAPDSRALQQLLPATENDPSSEKNTREINSETEEEEQKKMLNPTLRQVIQVSVAATLAIIAGELLSPQRWYWAAITAFITFAGTNSRGETFTKGWQRVAGTLTGVLAGIAIAYAINGHSNLALVLIFICVFMAFYLIQAAYSLMIFWITIALALFYSLLGRFSVHLLTLRIEETFIGAAIGVLVAIFLLPTSTRTAIRDASRDYLDKTGRFVEACVDRFVNENSGTNFIKELRLLDRDFQQLRGTAAPFSRNIAGVLGRYSTRRWLRALLGCRFYARGLGRIAHHAPQIDDDDTELRDALITLAEHIKNNIQTLTSERVKPKDPSEKSLRTSDINPSLDARLQNTDDPLHTAACYLQRMDQLIVDLANDFEHQN